jgi:hypothetical protein
MVLCVAMSGRWSYPVPNPDPGKLKGKGQEMACRFSVAPSDHGGRFGQAISRICTINMCASQGRTARTTNSGVEATHTHHGTLSPSLSQGNEEEERG